jgi:hypothetical protein
LGGSGIIAGLAVRKRKQAGEGRGRLKDGIGRRHVSKPTGTRRTTGLGEERRRRRRRALRDKKE